MPNPIPNLYDKLPDDLKGSMYRNLQDYFDKTVTIHNAKIQKDEAGVKAIFQVSDLGEIKKFFLSTRAAQPMAVAKFLIEQRAFPVNGKFVAQGRQTMLVDPSAVAQESETPEIPF